MADMFTLHTFNSWHITCHLLCPPDIMWHYPPSMFRFSLIRIVFSWYSSSQWGEEKNSPVIDISDIGQLSSEIKPGGAMSPDHNQTRFTISRIWSLWQAWVTDLGPDNICSFLICSTCDRVSSLAGDSDSTMHNARMRHPDPDWIAVQLFVCWPYLAPECLSVSTHKCSKSRVLCDPL